MAASFPELLKAGDTKVEAILGHPQYSELGRRSNADFCKFFENPERVRVLIGLAINGPAPELKIHEMTAEQLTLIRNAGDVFSKEIPQVSDRMLCDGNEVLISEFLADPQQRVTAFVMNFAKIFEVLLKSHKDKVADFFEARPDAFINILNHAHTSKILDIYADLCSLNPSDRLIRLVSENNVINRLFNLAVSHGDKKVQANACSTLEYFGNIFSRQTTLVSLWNSFIETRNIERLLKAGLNHEHKPRHFISLAREILKLVDSKLLTKAIDATEEDRIIPLYCACIGNVTAILRHDYGTPKLTAYRVSLIQMVEHLYRKWPKRASSETIKHGLLEALLETVTKFPNNNIGQNYVCIIVSHILKKKDVPLLNELIVKAQLPKFIKDNFNASDIEIQDGNYRLPFHGHLTRMAEELQSSGANDEIGQVTEDWDSFYESIIEVKLQKEEITEPEIEDGPELRSSSPK